MAKENWESIFPGVRKSVMASHFPKDTTDEKKQEAFEHVVRVLLNKSVFRPTGKVYDCRENSLDYFLDVIPRLEEEEITLIWVNKELFYKKFCFKPSAKSNSLYSRLLKLGVDINGRYNNIPVDEIFERYYAETGLSPYELPENIGVVNDFLEEVEAESAVFGLDFDWSVALKGFRCGLSTPFFY